MSGESPNGETACRTYTPIQAGQDWYGGLDEVRISTVDRSADWVATEYNNQNDPADFFTFNGAAPAPFAYAPVNMGPILGWRKPHRAGMSAAIGPQGNNGVVGDSNSDLSAVANPVRGQLFPIGRS